MKYKLRYAPHISYPESTRTLMSNVIILLLALYAIAFFYYGYRAPLLGLVGAVSAILAEWVCLLLLGKRLNIYDLSPIVTGLLIPLMMPASIPFQVPAIAAIFAIVVTKHPFGGLGNNIFNPAAAGYAFAIACFPSSMMFSYPLPLTVVPLFPTEALQVINSPAFTMQIGGVPHYDFITMALGNMPGPMGATNGLVLLACLIFLLSRRTLRWETPLFFLMTTSLCALLFPRIPVSRLDSLLYESMSGLLLFGALFMLGDPVTTPVRRTAKMAYSVLCGLVVMAYRHAANLEEGFVFALLLLNTTTGAFDILAEKLAHWQRRKKFGTLQHSKIQKKA